MLKLFLCLLLVVNFTHDTVSFTINRGISRILHCRVQVAVNNDEMSVSRKDTTKDFVASQLSVKDTLSIVKLAYQEFEVTCNSSLSARFLLFSEILSVYLPKLIFPNEVIGSTIVGVKQRGTENLVAISDVSLQIASGSLVALDKTLKYMRIQKYGLKNLKPYISNFLVKKEFRRQGNGEMLMSFILQMVHSLGFNEVFLHVDSKSIPAMSFYISLGFIPIRELSNGIIFMRKEVSD